MIQRNRLYVVIISVAAVLTFLNISAGRRSADHSLFDPLVDVCDLIQKYYVTETNDEELAAGAINGMLHKLDPYSEYIPADKVDAFHKQTSGSYEGIGTAIDIQDGYLTVISPFDGSPAYKAGVLSGDKILEVDGKSTKGWSATRAVQELTGDANTEVTLRLLHTDGT
jgi:carboxyl-terminal processing protease